MSNRAKPKKPRKRCIGPCETVIKPGIHYWCTCGKSVNHPLCDKTHDESEINSVPIEFEISEEAKFYLCGCQQTKSAPFCDGTHDQPP